MAIDMRVQYRAQPDHWAWLESRRDRAMSGRSVADRARVEVDMWRTVLAGELARQHWTLPELGMIASVIAGSLISDAVGVTAGRVAFELLGARAGREGELGAEWGCDESDVLERLLRLGPAGDAALADAVSRWWADDEGHTPEGWVAVGLAVADSPTSDLPDPR